MFRGTGKIKVLTNKVGIFNNEMVKIDIVF